MLSHNFVWMLVKMLHKPVRQWHYHMMDLLLLTWIMKSNTKILRPCHAWSCPNGSTAQQFWFLFTDPIWNKSSSLASTIVHRDKNDKAGKNAKWSQHWFFFFFDWTFSTIPLIKDYGLLKGTWDSFLRGHADHARAEWRSPAFSINRKESLGTCCFKFHVMTSS